MEYRQTDERTHSAHKHTAPVKHADFHQAKKVSEHQQSTRMTIATELSYTLDSHEHGLNRVHNNTKYRKGKYLSFLPYAGTPRIRLMGMISARSVRAPLIEIGAKILLYIETGKKKEYLLHSLSLK